MREQVRSLHARLLVVIIIPLLIVATIITIVRYYEARETTQQIYDNALLSIAHVITRDVVLNQGDLLANRLLDALTKALGDRVFYHLIGDQQPLLLSGYTPPPIVPNAPPEWRNEMPFFFDGTFRDEPVRAVSFREHFSNTTYNGWVKVIVWQKTGQREHLTLSLTGKVLIMLAIIILATAIIVWFGVSYGLKPLSDLQDAIERRSPDDLNPIQRAIPREVSSLVSAMNHLFAKVRHSFAEKDAFIANAAHQLRNPIAGLLSQAEAAERTQHFDELKKRVGDVAEAARRTARLTQQLLSMERVSQGVLQEQFEVFDITMVVQTNLARIAAFALKHQVELSLTGVEQPIMVKGSPILIGEVLDNLLDNALRYGCPQGGEIQANIACDSQTVTISISDNGAGIAPEFMPTLFERFTRGAEDGTDGCGLGLAIARSIIEKHQGQLQLHSDQTNTTAVLTLPRV